MNQDIFFHLFHRTTALPLAGVIVAFTLFTSCSSDQSSPDSTPVAGPGGPPALLTLGPDEKDYLLTAARGLLEDKADFGEPTKNLMALCGREVFVSLFRHGHPPIEKLALADCVLSGVKDAVNQIKADERFSRYYKGEMDGVRIKIDILDRKEKLSTKDLKKLKRLLEPGVWGPMLRVGDSFAYGLPDNVVTHGWGIDRKRGKRVRKEKMARKQLTELCGKAGLSPQAWKEAELSRFTTMSFIEERPAGKAIALYRGNPTLSHSFTEKDVIKSAMAAADNILKNMDLSTGRFGYLYYPDQDEFDEDYNVVRHAGTAWSLFKIYNATGEKRYMEGALASMKWFEQYFESPAEHQDIIIIKVDGPVSLGTMALATLAMTEIPDSHLTSRYKSFREKLGNCLLFFLLDDGRFYTYYEQAHSKNVPKRQARYYPGEATLALIGLYERTKDTKWLDAAIKAGKQQIHEFKKLGKPDNWSIQCMSRLYRHTGDREFLIYGYEMADYNIRHQFDPKRAEYPDYIGGFDNSIPPRTTPACSRTEAMDEAYLLARHAGDQASMKKYGDAIVWAMWFIMNNQVRPENVYWLPNPQRALGGIRGGLIANDIRIDYDQHAILALLNGLEVLRDRRAIKEETFQPPKPMAEDVSYQRLLNRTILDSSLALGNKFLLNHQKPEGNFTYEYDFLKKEYATEDSQVRQAGASWGMTLIHHDQPSEETSKAIIKALEFFASNSKETTDGRRYVVYPGAEVGRTGTVALVALALVEFLRSESHLDSELRNKYEDHLSQYIAFLLSLRMSGGQFHQSYRLENGEGVGSPSPYSDGESLLALVKAAKYVGHTELKNVIMESAESMYKNNVEQALKNDPDSATTKGFYQWGSMAYYELYTTGWEDVNRYPKRVIDLAYWMIDVHQTLRRTRNTAYAHEGLVVAWELARLTGNKRAMAKIGHVIDRGLYKLTSWQVGGPLEDKFSGRYKTDDPEAIGGVLNHKNEALLRIDVTQHQTHAVILARRYIYKE